MDFPASSHLHDMNAGPIRHSAPSSVPTDAILPATPRDAGGHPVTQQNQLARRQHVVRFMEQPTTQAVARHDAQQQEAVKQDWHTYLDNSLKNFKHRSSTMERHLIEHPIAGAVLGFFGGMAIGMVLAYVEGRRMTEDHAAGKPVGKPVFATNYSPVIAGAIGALITLLGHAGYSLYTTRERAGGKGGDFGMIRLTELVVRMRDEITNLMPHPATPPEPVDQARIDAWRADLEANEGGAMVQWENNVVDRPASGTADSLSITSASEFANYRRFVPANLQVPVGDGHMVIDMDMVSAGLQQFIEENQEGLARITPADDEAAPETSSVRAASSNKDDTERASQPAGADNLQAVGKTLMQLADHLRETQQPPDAAA